MIGIRGRGGQIMIWERWLDIIETILTLQWPTAWVTAINKSIQSICSTANSRMIKKLRSLSLQDSSLSRSRASWSRSVLKEQRKMLLHNQWEALKTTCNRLLQSWILSLTLRYLKKAKEIAINRYLMLKIERFRDRKPPRYLGIKT